MDHGLNRENQERPVLSIISGGKDSPPPDPHQEKEKHRRVKLVIVADDEEVKDIRADLSDFKNAIPDRINAAREIMDTYYNDPDTFKLDHAIRLIHIAGGIERHARSTDDIRLSIEAAKLAHRALPKAVASDKDVQNLAKQYGDKAYANAHKHFESVLDALYDTERKKEPNLSIYEFRKRNRTPENYAEHIANFASLKIVNSVIRMYQGHVYERLLRCVDPIGQHNREEALGLSRFVTEESAITISLHGSSQTLATHRYFALAQMNRYNPLASTKDDLANINGEEIARAVDYDGFVVRRAEPGSIVRQEARKNLTARIYALADRDLDLAVAVAEKVQRQHATRGCSFESHMNDVLQDLHFRVPRTESSGWRDAQSAAWANQNAMAAGPR